MNHSTYVKNLVFYTVSSYIEFITLEVSVIDTYATYNH